MIPLRIWNTSANSYYRGLQILLFIPGIDNKSLTLTAKFNDMNDKSRVDLKSSVLPIHEPVAVRSAAATPDSERFV